LSDLSILTDAPTPSAAGCLTGACSQQRCRPAAGNGSRSLLDELLAEQQSMTAVETFAATSKPGPTSARAELYRALMPAAPPAPGQQYAFQVDLDSCSGCKACVTACHTLNGLDEFETWRDVGLLVGGSRSSPVIQHVTTACHHCLEPACMAACPVNAYEKNSVTGIVTHLDDQCFGCQYCTLACPYEVPKYHPGKGIVRKCDMCSSRLAVGEAPACVQSCPHQAISIHTVDVQQILEEAETGAFLPGAPDPQITYPSTLFKSKKPFPRNLLPADYYRVGPQHAHLPLVVMLVLTQLSVGAFTVGLILDQVMDDHLVMALRPWQAASALGFGLLALASSVLHLGRPRYAFRAVLGLRHSWLSREIVAFGAFAKLACVYAGAVMLARDPLSPAAPFVECLGWAVSATGGIAIFCSAMVYVFTQRECWSATRVGVRFILTSAWLGVAVVWLSILLLAVASSSSEFSEVLAQHGAMLCQSMMTIAAVKLLWEATIFRHLLFRRMTPLKRSALLMARDLSNVTFARFAAGVLGGLLMPALLLSGVSSVSRGHGLLQFVVNSGMLFAACLAGELLERSLFFTACAAPRMPGGIR
jgi:formate dehydrogenase iron-sulfur subunit